MAYTQEQLEAIVNGRVAHELERLREIKEMLRESLDYAGLDPTYEESVEMSKWRKRVEEFLGVGCIDDQHRGTECKCCHAIYHCRSHHCCCFYRCKCRHSQDKHPNNGKCTFDDNCRCEKYAGEKR